MENENFTNKKKSDNIESEELDYDYKKNDIDLNSSNFDEKMDIEESKALDFSVILVGDSNVGKTSILKKFINGTFANKLTCTINVEFSAKNLKIDKNLYAKLVIFDTAGQEKYRSLTRQYYNKANGIILVFDLTNENSFTKLNYWIKEINDNAGNVEVFLVGNKSDLEDRKISKLKAENFAKEKNLRYIETSAKEGTNILLLFEELSIGMNKRRNEESTSNVEMGSVDTYICRRAELNKELKNKKEAKCC
jgi:small GTP-binding protein